MELTATFKPSKREKAKKSIDPQSIPFGTLRLMAEFETNRLAFDRLP
jgi:hypothetical protein